MRKRPITAIMVYRIRFLIVSATLFLAPMAVAGAEVRSSNDEIKSRGDVQRMVLRGAKQQSDWTIAYAVMTEYLSSFPKYEMQRLDEYELLGLSREEVKRVIADYYGMERSERGGIDLFYLGCGQGGLSIQVKCQSNKVHSVCTTSFGRGSSSPGPWISSRIKGIRKAELDVSSHIQIWQRERHLDFSWCEVMRAFYRKRGQLRHYLEDDESATKDLVEAASLPILPDNGGDLAIMGVYPIKVSKPNPAPNQSD